MEDGANERGSAVFMASHNMVLYYCKVISLIYSIRWYREDDKRNPTVTNRGGAPADGLVSDTRNFRASVVRRPQGVWQENTVKEF
jgi:hypothetical protein